MEKQPDLSTLTEQEKDTLIITLLGVIDALRLQVQQLTEEREHVKGQLGKNSRNSSKPPSSDGLSKPAPKSLRKPSGQKSGGRKGYKGHFLEAIAEPDVVEHHPAMQCAVCANGLGGVAAEGHDGRQVFDIPVPRLEVTAYRAERKRCPCGHPTTAAFPLEASVPVRYGPRIKAVAVYLNQYQLVPYARVEEMLESLYDTHLCEGSLFNFNQRAYENLEDTENRIKAALLQQEVLHADESGIRVEGKLHWVHTLGSAGLTHYQHHPKRGQTAMEDIGLLPNYTGIVVHDHLKAYLRYTGFLHGLCNAHHLRELAFLLERGQLEWAGEMTRLLAVMKKCVDRAKRRRQTSLSPRHETTRTDEAGQGQKSA